MKTLLAVTLSLVLTGPAYAEIVQYNFVLDRGGFNQYMFVDTSVQDSNPATDQETYFNAIQGIAVLSPTQGRTATLDILHAGTVDHISFTAGLLSASQPFLLTMNWDQAPSNMGGFPSLGHIFNGSYSVEWAHIDGFPPTDFSGVMRALNYGGVGGTYITPPILPTPVPLPPAVWLFGAGLGVVIWLRMRGGRLTL